MRPDKSGAREQGMGGIEGGEKSAGHSHQSLSASSSQGDSGGMQLEGTAGFIGLNLTLKQARHIVSDRLFKHRQLGQGHIHVQILLISLSPAFVWKTYSIFIQAKPPRSYMFVVIICVTMVSNRSVRLSIITLNCHFAFTSLLSQTSLTLARVIPPQSISSSWCVCPIVDTEADTGALPLPVSATKALALIMLVKEIPNVSNTKVSCWLKE